MLHVVDKWLTESCTYFCNSFVAMNRIGITGSNALCFQ